jgi:hypothetical protein
MDCSTARTLLELARPWAGEPDAAETAVLREHLAGCPACAALAQRTGGVDEQLGKAVRDVAVPPELRGRLLARLAGERRLLLRRRVGRLATAAAVLLAALGTVWFVRHSLRPVPDAVAIVQDDNARATNSPERVEDWFREHGIAMVAPTRFNDAQLNYALLDSYGLGDFQGCRVPQLLFFQPAGGAALARVYVLSGSAFNLDDPAAATSAAGSGHRVEVFRHPDRPDVAYVVIYTGESLSPFFIRPQPGA